MRLRHPLTICLIAPILLAALSFGVLGQNSPAEKYLPGIIVTSVTPGSPADKTGIKKDDLVLSLDGTPIRFVTQIAAIRDQALWDGKTTIPITIKRGMESLTLSLTVAPLL